MFMEYDLEELLKRARMRSMTPEERLVQSISFVFGNANIERDTLTRGTVTLSIPSKPKDEKK
jgi:hypothetical protein